MNDARVRLYERLMEAQEQIAHARYAHGVSDHAVLAAMDAAEALSDEQRREDLYLSTLAAYVEALGGRLELLAVFSEETVVIEREAV